MESFQSEVFNRWFSKRNHCGCVQGIAECEHPGCCSFWLMGCRTPGSTRIPGGAARSSVALRGVQHHRCSRDVLGPSTRLRKMRGISLDQFFDVEARRPLYPIKEAMKGTIVRLRLFGSVPSASGRSPTNHPHARPAPLPSRPDRCARCVSFTVETAGRFRRGGS